MNSVKVPIKCEIKEVKKYKNKYTDAERFVENIVIDSSYLTLESTQNTVRVLDKKLFAKGFISYEH